MTSQPDDDHDGARSEPPGTLERDPATNRAPAAPDDLVEAELLVEDVSIDGMCGVY